MRVLVTGASGYLGGKIAEHFAARGHDVVRGTRHPELIAAQRGSVVAHLEWNAPAMLDDVCRGVDAIVHAAGMNARECAADPARAHEVNGANTARLVTAATRTGVAHFLYLSTAHVYAAPLRGRIAETTCPMNAHPYATSHRAGENAVLAAQARSELRGVVVRLSNAYGPPVRKEADCWTLVANDLARQAATTGRMTLRTSGVQRRDFMPISDACRAIEHLICAADVTGDIVNVGGSWAPTVLEIAKLIQARSREVLGRDAGLERAVSAGDETTDDLDYRIDALLASGFQPSGDREGEIDRLLAFCAAAFGAR